jgi:hypothetical protein
MPIIPNISVKPAETMNSSNPYTTPFSKETVTNSMRPALLPSIA